MKSLERIKEENRKAREEVVKWRDRHEKQVELIVAQGQEISEGIATLIDLMSALENVLKTIRDDIKKGVSDD